MVKTKTEISCDLGVFHLMVSSLALIKYVIIPWAENRFFLKRYFIVV